MTGWVTLPDEITDEKFDAINAAADKIKADSDYLIVVGIGGSFLGACTVIDMLDRLLGNAKTATTTLPAQGIFAVMKQPTEGGERLVNHLAYAIPKLRGKNTEIIEDIPAVLDTKVSVKVNKKPARIYLAPSMEELDFTYTDGSVTYTVPKIECSTLAVIEF
jgi:hypothetical protein